MLSRENNSAPRTIGGIHVAAITPRRPREVEVDLGAMLDLVDFLGSYPIQGITLFGTTGEFLHFTIEERSRYVQLLAKRSKVPVMANVSHSTMDGALLMAEEAAGAGVAGVLLMPPYYFHYSAATLETIFLQFVEHISKWLPVYIYNIPSFTDGLTVELLERLLSSGLFAGIKDSSGNWDLMRRLLELKESQQVTVLVGHDTLFAPARSAGASGAVSGVACALPELMLALDRAISVSNTEAAKLLNGRVQEFIGRLACFPVPIGIKAAVEARGIKAGPHSIPLDPDLSRELSEFQMWFREWLPAIQQECKHVP